MAHWAIARLGWRQTLRGAIIFGLLIAILMPLQGYAYAKSYSTAEQRRQFTTTLRSNASLGVIYGEPAALDGDTTRGYMMYRTVAFLALAGAVWGMLASTKLLRGNEEEGRSEIILAGPASPRQATADLLGGLAASILSGYLICGVLVMVLTRGAEFNLPIASSWLLSLAVFMPAIIFACFGGVVSQLATSRRRTLAYGLIPLVILYVLRALGNTLPGWYWLKYSTPFGWVDLLSPVMTPQLIWLVAFSGLGLLSLALTLWLTGRRDWATSIWAESKTRHVRTWLLAGPWQFSLRRNWPVFVIWLLGVGGLSFMMSALVSTAAQAGAGSAQLNQTLDQLSGGAAPSLRLAFLSASTLLVTFGILLLVITGLNDLAREEFRQRADLALTRTVSRSRWLVNHLLVIMAVCGGISLISAIITWVMANRQGLVIHLSTFLSGSLQAYGSIVFLAGVGILWYGLRPRFMPAVLYGILTWSFGIDIVSAVAKLPNIISQTSLLHYVSPSPAVSPNWPAFGYLVGLGVVMIGLGNYFFNRRDIITD